MESEKEGMLTVDELEDVSQYQAPMAIDASTVAGSHIATKFASDELNEAVDSQWTATTGLPVVLRGGGLGSH